MSQEKLINFDVMGIKPTKPVLLAKPLNSLDSSEGAEESEKESHNPSGSLPYDKMIDHIASTTSGIIDNTSIANSPRQILNTSLSHEKLEISSSNREMLKHHLLNMSTKRSNESVKGASVGKETLSSSSNKYISIDIMNNPSYIDTTDTNTISNEVMTLSSEEDMATINKASSEISETTLNQGQPSSLNIDGIKTFRRSTSELESFKSVSPTTPTSPSSPKSMIIGATGHPLITPRSYSALIEDNTGSPLRNSFSLYSNYTFSYANSMLDDNDSESALTKKKKSVRFSNIVDVIDSDQKDSLSKLGDLDTESKGNQETNYPEYTTVINIDDTGVTDEDMTTMTSSNSRISSSNTSFVVKVEEFIAFFFRYIIFAFNSVFKLFKKGEKKRKKRSSLSKNQYAIIDDNGLSSLTPVLSEEDTSSQSSTVGDSNIVDTISPSSQSYLNDLNSTQLVFSNKKKKSKKNFSPSYALSQIGVVKNDTNDIELSPLNPPEKEDSVMEHLIIESEVVKCMHAPLTSSSSSSSLNSNSTTTSESSESSVNSPVTINLLSHQKGSRVVRYWYNDTKKKSMAQRFGLVKPQSSYILKDNSNKQNIIVKQGDKTIRPTLVSKNPENPLIPSSKVKRSSLVNFKPTNIDINNLPNINMTTTTNTILNSSSAYRGQSGMHGKEIIIRDLNTTDGVYYSINLDRLQNGNVDLLPKSKENETKNISLPEASEITGKTQETIKPEPAVSFSTPPSFKETEDLKRSARKFSHRRQNSVRLQISY